jgi:hypothetical protein
MLNHKQIPFFSLTAKFLLLFTVSVYSFGQFLLMLKVYQEQLLITDSLWVYETYMVLGLSLILAFYSAYVLIELLIKMKKEVKTTE